MGSNGNMPNSIIKAKTPISLEISFTTPGIYIIEVNSVSGMALINRPFYVGDGLPLLPDYNDLLTSTMNSGGS